MIQVCIYILSYINISWPDFTAKSCEIIGNSPKFHTISPTSSCWSRLSWQAMPDLATEMLCCSMASPSRSINLWEIPSVPVAFLGVGYGWWVKSSRLVRIRREVFSAVTKKTKCCFFLWMGLYGLVIRSLDRKPHKPTSLMDVSRYQSSLKKKQGALVGWLNMFHVGLRYYGTILQISRSRAVSISK